MSGEWTMRPFADLTENFDERRIPVKETDRRVGPFPYYGASGVVDYVDNHIFDGEYLLIAEDGENLRTRNTLIAFLARGKFWVNNHAHIVRGNSDSDTRFLMYALAATDISGYLTGSTMPKLTQGNMNRIPLPAPPIDEQRAIASILGALDDKIDLNRRMNATLEEIARAIFRSWFVDFDPVHAKSEGRNLGLPTPIADLFPDSFKDSKLGEIPKGWRIVSLCDLVEQIKDHENPFQSPNISYYHYSIPAYDEGRLPRIELGSSIKSMKWRVPNGVILISKLNPEIPRVWLANVEPNHHAVCSTEFLVLRPKSEFTRSYVYCLACSPLFRRQMESLVTGTSKSHQRAQSVPVLGIEVIAPPTPIILAFNQLTEALLRLMLESLHESSTLASMRDTLLPKLISGELRVKDAERFIGNSA